MYEVPSLLGKSGKTVEKCIGEAAAVDMLPHYSEELGAGNTSCAEAFWFIVMVSSCLLQLNIGPSRRSPPGGISLLPAFVIMFVIQHYQLSWEDALHMVQNRRYCISPNSGSLTQIKVCIKRVNHRGKTG
jgi:hypothetical protein